MSSEDELRSRLHDDAARSTYTDAAHTIDVSQVISRSRGRRGPRMLLAGGGATLAVLGIAVTAAFGLPALADMDTTPPPFAETATPTAAPTATPSPDPVAIPSDCSGIYTKDWTPEMAGLELNLSPEENPAAAGEALGTGDDELKTVLAATTKLSCDWMVPPQIGHDLGGLYTDVASITPEQSSAVLARMSGAGFTCSSENEGMRCDLRQESTEGSYGESHFVRDGIWVATYWFYVWPDGYTDDIEKAIFGSSAEPPASAVEIPGDCSGIYTKDWTPDFKGLVLNPARPGDESQKYAALDDVFGPALQANSKLGCLWASTDPLADEVGLRTEVASVTPELQASLIEHARTSGYTCSDEFGGTRCDIESEAEVEPGQARSGTTHFFRDGIWVSTWWSRINPAGYTVDIEKALFGDSAPPATVAVEVPSDCSGIYTKDWAPEMWGHVLNPAWADGPDGTGVSGSNDEDLVATLTDTVELSCYWLNARGPSDNGHVTTDIAALTSEQTAAVLGHMNDIGFSCYPEHGGTRCVIEREGTEGPTGESHFLRDGIWSATAWYAISPDGYTADIERALFGD